jgi:(S)-3,5-dihydroxyphenylglycine transaminase
MTPHSSSATPVAGRAQLHKPALLHALADPALGAISFLNEVIDRFPQAISFAPGAPFAKFFDDLDVARHIERYERHLVEDKGLTPARAKRRLYQYGPAQGVINDLLARALRIDHGMDVAPEAIVVTVGCQEAMVLALRALCPTPDDLLAIVNPCFVGIAGAAKVLGIDPVAIDETSSGVDLGALDRACIAARRDGQRIRALYVAPDFSNPSGTLMDLPTRHALLAAARAHDFLLLEDDAYGFTAESGSALPTLKALDAEGRVIYLGTCAKICLPGVRVGFMVADQEVVDEAGKTTLLASELTLIKSMLTVNTSPICQAIVGGMMLEHDGSLAAVGREKALLYRRNLRHLLDALSRHLPPALCAQQHVSWNEPQGGFFVRVRLPVVADYALLERCAARHGVLWTPMSSFFLDGAGRHELRLACSYLTPEEIDEGVARFARFVADDKLMRSS